MKQPTLIAASLVLGLACASAKANGENIAFLTKNQTNPFWQAVRLGADNAAKQLNARLTHFVPTKADSIPEQMSQLEDLAIKKPAAVVMVPVDAKALVPGIQKLNAGNIPVMNMTDRAAAGRFIGFVGSDDYHLGLEVGRHLLKAMGGKGNVIIIEGVSGTLTNTERLRGYSDALKEYPEVKVLASQPANYHRVQALQIVENLLQAHRSIDGILSANDSMALGAIEALEAANRKALVVGINGIAEAFDAVAKGRMLAVGDYDGFTQGCLATTYTIQHLRKQATPKEVVIKPTVVTRELAAQYVATPVEKRQCPSWEEARKLGS